MIDDELNTWANGRLRLVSIAQSARNEQPEEVLRLCASGVIEGASGLAATVVLKAIERGPLSAQDLVEIFSPMLKKMRQDWEQTPTAQT